MSLTETLQCAIREAGPGDIPYIGSSLGRSYAADAKGAEATVLDSDTRRKLARDRLARSRGTIIVATDPEDDDLIMGWAWHEVPILHYVYVRETFRGQGIALQLLVPFASQHRIYCSHWTRAFQKFSNARPQLYWRI